MMATSDGRRPTLRAIAERAGVSVMTVSYTFNNPERVAEATRTRVLSVASELGYHGKNPWATALRARRGGALGVVFSEHLTYAFTDLHASEFLTGVSSVCTEADLGLTFIPTRGRPDDAERVAAAPVDGYVFWTTREDDPCLAAAVATHRPCAIQGGPAYDGFVTVGVPDRVAATSIAELAVKGGARHPVVVSFNLDTARVRRAGYGVPLSSARLPVTRARLEGFHAALTSAGIAWQDTYVSALSGNGRDEAEHVFTELLSKRIPVDLALCTSDEIALGVLRALEAENIAVPDDVAVTGWDDGKEAATKGLSTVRQSLYDQGRSCGLVAAGLAAEAPEAQWQVVARGTTRRPPASRRRSRR